MAGTTDESSYDVRIYATDVYQGKRTTTYWVQWSVAGKRWKEPFKTAALADSFRSELVAAARKGEAFEIATGRPISMQRADVMDWYELATRFADMKWKRAAATTRRTHAEALAKVTMCLLKDGRRRPPEPLIRMTLNRWAFNCVKRDDPSAPQEVRETLKWLEKNTQPVSRLAKPDILRGVLDRLTVRLDGKPTAPVVVNRQRRIFYTCLEYAVELNLLPRNPIPKLKWTPPATSYAIDRRCVPNPVQVRTLLDAIRHGLCGERLVAFFGCLYFAGLRPEEAVSLRKHNLDLPSEGWGELHLTGAEPHAGKDWTDSGENRDRRQLKQRAVGEGRDVPCPPELTALLHEHIGRFGYAPDGRLFTGERNKSELPKGTISRAWREARRATFTPEVCASPLAATPYDLRHACISLWIQAGVPPATAAKWAGQSIEILFRIYAAWLAGTELALRKGIDDAYGNGG